MEHNVRNQQQNEKITNDTVSVDNVLGHQNLLTEEQSAIRIQRCFRGHRLRVHLLSKHYDLTASIIQQYWRNFLRRRHNTEIRNNKEDIASIHQASMDCCNKEKLREVHQVNKDCYNDDLEVDNSAINQESKYDEEEDCNEHIKLEKLSKNAQKQVIYSDNELRSLWLSVAEQYDTSAKKLRKYCSSMKTTSTNHRVRDLFTENTEFLKKNINSNPQLLNPGHIEELYTLRDSSQFLELGYQFEAVLKLDKTTKHLLLPLDWVSQVYDERYIRQLEGNDVNTDDVLWTENDLAMQHNSKEDKEVLSIFPDMNEPKHRITCNEEYVITGILLQCRWEKLRRSSKLKQKSKKWFITSTKKSDQMTSHPTETKYDKEWQESDETFLREGFGDYYLHYIEEKSAEEWKNLYCNSTSDTDSTEGIIETYEYIDTSQYYCTYNLGFQQICGIMWSESKQKYRGMYVYEFENRTKSLFNKYKIDDLDDEWIQQEFGDKPAVLERAKEKSSTKHPFVPVPGARSRRKKRRHYCDKKTSLGTLNVHTSFEELVIDTSQLPIVHYQQEENDTCLCDAIASGFHHINEKELAYEIHQYGRENPTCPNMYDCLFNDVLMKSVPFKLKFQQVKIKNRDFREFNILDNADRKGIQALTIFASDSSVDHVIVCVDGYIFDPNKRYALPLTKENLDKCCGSNVEFMAVRNGRWYKPHVTTTCKKSKMKKRKIKLCMESKNTKRFCPEKCTG